MRTGDLIIELTPDMRVPESITLTTSEFRELVKRYPKATLGDVMILGRDLKYEKRGIKYNTTCYSFNACRGGDNENS